MKADSRVCTIDGADDRWMVALGQASRSASTVVITNFKATTPALAFVRAISSEQQLAICVLEDAVILQRPENTAKPAA